MIDQPGSPRFVEAPALARALRRAIFLYLAFLALAATTVLPLPPGLRLGTASGAVMGSLLVALAALVPCAMSVSRRATLFRRSDVPSVTRSAHGRARGFAILGLAALAGYAAWRFGLDHAGPPAELARRLAVGGALTVAAFPLLIVERFVARVPATAMPEAGDLAALLYVPVVVVLATGVLEAAAGLGIGTVAVTWLETGLAIYTAAVAAELAIRSLVVVLAPRASAQPGQAVVGSALARLLRPGALSAARVSNAVKQQFGLDFSRSWAIRFVRGACFPVLVSSAAFCWFLSGVVSIGLNERGQYERFGVPAQVLQSGLHLVLPWPLGTVRKVEHGVIHSVTIGDAETTTTAAPGAFVPTAVAGPIGAEDIPPPSANRLWDQPRQSEISYIIAGTSSDQQSFEMIGADLRVLFRVGLDDASVRLAAYRTSDPPTLVRTLARELLAQFFATRTLSEVLGADREAIANLLQQQLAARLVALRTGIEIVAVIVEAAQPPNGAADAYHHVQAAQIAAITEISMERGRAVASASVATRDAHETLNKAAGAAAEAIDAANVDLTEFQADDRAYQAGGHAFILERYFANLKSALGRTVLEILDDRLAGPSQPTLDLRPPGGMDDMPPRNPRQ